MAHLIQLPVDVIGFHARTRPLTVWEARHADVQAEEPVKRWRHFSLEACATGAVSEAGENHDHQTATDQSGGV